MAHRQVDYDLVPEGVADERRAFQPDIPHPGDERVGEPGHVQDATGLLTLAEAGQLGCIDPMVGSQLLEGDEHVAAGDDQPRAPGPPGDVLRAGDPRGACVHPRTADRGADNLDLYGAPDQRSSGRISFSKNRKKPSWSGPIWCM
jgi:hypothetical protein